MNYDINGVKIFLRLSLRYIYILSLSYFMIRSPLENKKPYNFSIHNLKGIIMDVFSLLEAEMCTTHHQHSHGHTRCFVGLLSYQL